MRKEIILIIILALLAVLFFLLNRMRKAAADLNLVRIGLKQSCGSERASRFCLISDIHISKMTVPWGTVLEAVKECSPEFILITGDLVNTVSDIEAARDFIFTLAMGTGLPVLITAGNHDNSVACELPGGREELFKRFTDMPGDVRVLDNESCVIGGALVLGLDDVQHFGGDAQDEVNKCAQKAAENGLNFILATHSADLLVRGAAPLKTPSEGISGVLCGHTHGGQIRLAAGLEFGLLKNDILPRRGIYYGPHEVEGFPVYITSGLGCALFPLRMGTRPEVVLVTVEDR